MYFPITNKLSNTTIKVGWLNTQDDGPREDPVILGTDDKIMIRTTNDILYIVVPPNTKFKLNPYMSIAFLFYQIEPNSSEFNGDDVYVYAIDKENDADLSVYRRIEINSGGGDGEVGDPEDDIPKNN